MEIEELPDLKIAWHQSDKYLKVPLLEYVWIIAEKFMPAYEDVSTAPAIFANRYAERNLTIEERYERAREMRLLKGTQEAYRETSYRKLDDSFKDKFLNNKDLQNTIDAFGLDISKFWYLLLFVYDFIEDIGTNAPLLGKSVLEDFNSFHASLLEATSITLKKNNRKSYATEREDTIRIIQAALQHFVKTYNDIVNENNETMIEQLKDIGLDGCVANDLLSKISFEEKFSLDISYKKWKFTDMFQFFLENRKATIKPNTKMKVSKDKMMFISRLIYTIGYDGKRYNEDYDAEGNPNRMLSNLLRRYRNEQFPSIIANNYMVQS